MQEEEIKIILEKYRNGSASEMEKAVLESWYLSYQESESKELGLEERSKDLEKVLANLDRDYLHTKTIKLWPRLAVAVSIGICLFAGFYFYRSAYQLAPADRETAKNIIKPGENKAYLTLADGKRITLSDTSKGEIAKQPGISITKTINGELIYTVIDNGVSAPLAFNTFETPRGGQYQLRLPDGTKVWMNAASSLKYPASFATLKERSVELNGEAYFEVAKDPVKPFIVKIGEQQVQVLGTHFNINAYNDEPGIRTTLLEGSIQINNSNNNKRLYPGQMALTNGNDITISKADVDQAVAWKNGDFVFEDVPLQAIMRQISRWYDVEASYVGVIAEVKFGGSISRTKNINEVLNVLEMTKGVHFKIEGRRILVMP